MVRFILNVENLLVHSMNAVSDLASVFERKAIGVNFVSEGVSL